MEVDKGQNVANNICTVKDERQSWGQHIVQDGYKLKRTLTENIKDINSTEKI